MTVTDDFRIAEPVSVGSAELVDFVLATDPFAEPAFIERVFLGDDFVEERQLVVARLGDRIAGVGLTGHPKPMPAGWQLIRTQVDPALRNRGLGGALHRQLLDLAPASRGSLRSFAYDADPRDLQVAQRWGFDVLQRSFKSNYDLSSVPELPPLPAGVTIEDCSTLEFPDADEVEAMYDRSQTNPERAHFVGTLAYLHDMAPPPMGVGALLRVDGRPAALVWAMKELPSVHIAWTGVDPAYRGRGLGDLLKRQLHLMARDLGATACTTNNEEHNSGIRHVNASLGYVVEYGEYWLARQRES